MKTIIAVMFLLFAGAAQGQEHATLQQQKTCADQAKKVFDSEKRDDVDQDYVSHFDTKQNICFIGVRTEYRRGTTETAFVSLSVRDAFELRTYAVFMWFFSAPRPDTCSVKPRGQKEIKCANRSEFEEAIGKYFGIAF